MQMVKRYNGLIRSTEALHPFDIGGPGAVITEARLLGLRKAGIEVSIE